MLFRIALFCLVCAFQSTAGIHACVVAVAVTVAALCLILLNHLVGMGHEMIRAGQCARRNRVLRLQSGLAVAIPKMLKAEVDSRCGLKVTVLLID